MAITCVGVAYALYINKASLRVNQESAFATDDTISRRPRLVRMISLIPSLVYVCRFTPSLHVDMLGLQSVHFDLSQLYDREFLNNAFVDSIPLLCWRCCVR